MIDLSIILPAWNESKLIFNSIKTTENLMGDYGLNYEIIVVDDGSSDGTYTMAMEAAKGSHRVKVVRKEKHGKGSALKYGFNFCSGRLVTFMDADLDIHPRQIPLFIEYMEKYDADVVVGSKRHPLSKINYPLFRKVLSSGYQILIKILFRLNIKDTQAGLKLFKYDVLKEIFPRVLCKKYAFDLELLVNAHHRGFKIVEAPVELNWQRVANRIKLKEISKIALDTAAIFYRLRILKYYDGISPSNWKK